MFLLPVNQTSIFSWREGRTSTNVNKAGEREGGRGSTSTLLFVYIAQSDSEHGLEEETRKGWTGGQIKIYISLTFWSCSFCLLGFLKPREFRSGHEQVQVFVLMGGSEDCR